MAQCYSRINMNAKASAAYQNAIRYGITDSLATLRLARSLHGEGKYAAAVKAYNDYLAADPNNELAKTGLIGARMATDKEHGKTRHVVKNAKLFNSRRADFAPM
ncbi:MAG: tetratricopeptide repeat protein, partial [Muribaculaceae bacterium]|nr:tetratricopeptide repeat protein [Muribaculaceae bacterium]